MGEPYRCRRTPKRPLDPQQPHHHFPPPVPDDRRGSDDTVPLTPAPKPPPVMLAIDIGGTKFAAGLVSPQGDLVDRSVVLVEDDVGPESHFKALAGIIEQQLEATERHRVRVTAVGIGSAGPITPNCETVSPVNLPAWREFPLRARVRELTGKRVYGDLDGKALALAEGWQGAAKGYQNYCVLTVSTGIGGGIVIDGELVDGALRQRRPRRSHHRRPERTALRVRSARVPRGRGVGAGHRGDHRALADGADLRDHAAHGPDRRARGGVAVQPARPRAGGGRRRRGPRVRGDVLQRRPGGAEHAMPAALQPPRPDHADPARRSRTA